MQKLTQEYLKSCLHYDEETGVFTWLKRPLEHFKNAHGCNAWNARYPGAIAGSTESNNYLTIGINGKSYMAHRLAWLYVHGVPPKDQIDHINGDRSDNRIANLREANNFENRRNSKVRKDSKSGFKGVFWRAKKQKWMACIGYNYSQVHLGYFETAEEAHAAYCAASKKYHGRFARAS